MRVVIALIGAGLAVAAFFALAHEPVKHDPGHDPVVVKDDPPDPPKKDIELRGRQVYVDKSDLVGIKKRGKIRFLVFGDQQQVLQRSASTLSDDRAQARKFAFELGLVPVFVRVDSFNDLIPDLLAGKGDVIASRMTATDARAAKVKFTAPTAVVSEVLVGRADDDRVKSKADLAGKTVWVRPGTAYEKNLAKLDPAPAVKAFPASVDDAHAVHRVAVKEVDFTVVDSDLLAAIESYEENIERKLDIKSGAQIAWAVRPDATVLHQKANEFLTARSMTKHTTEVFDGDLDGMKERGSIRVLTRNNPVTYFLHRGNQYGFDFELAKLLAKDLGLRLEIVVPETFGEMIEQLNAGKGDFIAGQMTATEQRAADVAFTKPYLYVNEMLVHKKGSPKLDDVNALDGKTVHVREGSSYNGTLKALKKQGIKVNIAYVDEKMETEAIIAKVEAGEIEYTVSDDTILKVEMAYGREVEPALQLTSSADGQKDNIGKAAEGGAHIAFAVRKKSPKLLEAINKFIDHRYRGIEYNTLKARYFKNERQIGRSLKERFAESGKISPYDALFKKYAKHYGLDWRLLAAQAYQESRFDPNAVSWVGAQGIFQVMPATGRELGFTKLKDPEVGIHAGAKYMAQLVGQFESTLEFRQRMRFALASYNAGRGHVQDARRLAKKLGKNPDRWFHNVEDAMRLLSQRKYAKQARHGYCRGDEPVQYVSKIQSRYDAYSKIVK